MSLKKYAGARDYQEFVGYDKSFRFYWKHNGKPLEGFMQRNSMLIFMLAKSHTGGSVHKGFDRVNIETSKAVAA